MISEREVGDNVTPSGLRRVKRWSRTGGLFPTVVANINRYASVIGDAARADPTPNRYSTFDQAVAGLESVLPDMRARLEKLIALPSP
jgi:hypothetical protein